MYNIFSENKKKLQHFYKGYDLASILSFDIAFLSYGNSYSLLKEIIKIFLVRDIRPPLINSNVFFSMGPYGERKDYYEILDYVMSQVGVKDYFNIGGCKYKPGFSVTGFLFSIKYVFFKKLNLSFKSRLLLFSRMQHYYNTIDYLIKNKSDFKYDKYCGFCTAHPYECILNNYFRLRNIETYTLQHGLYVFSDSPQMDVIAFDNMVSDYVLCWGEYTANEFLKSGLSAEKIKISGYPRYTKKLKPYKIPGPYRIIFLCARRVYDETNKKIMEIIGSIKSEMNISVSIKIHPSLDKQKYKDLCECLSFDFYDEGTVSEALSSGGYDIVVTYNSSAYFDAYIGNRVALKYVDKMNDIFIDITDDNFSNSDELNEAINRVISSSNNQQTWTTISAKLSSSVGFELNNYQRLLGK
ncbi:hypothetical protein IG605_012970 [Pectobacterium quasiaquaticum]|uniref:hypothetical protein n=1 Tax=Pectobacterium quasiaquaticum TaxID=2774015 RepID=UPI0018774C9E|nr:hypothetical protein [Pectobacterium quasiaquaticum]MBE5215357.1 hypothetical protein [Pectobacterium quasiaquaticum]MBE5227423.1 hypothetical protein [Pectobacterium quasiaquaticum]URG51615.1 hypothetical protein IG605_012970 [Pectobacterium quasiaquaticum]